LWLLRYRYVARKLLFLYAAMALAAVLLQVAFGHAVGDLFARGPTRPHAPELDIAAGTALGLATVLASRYSSGVFAWARTIDAEFREVLSPIAARHVLAIAAFSSFAEELLFRGFLQAYLGLAITSVLFGLVHLPHRREMVPWTLAAVVMGFAFGWLQEWRGSIVAPVIAHFSINYFNLHYLLRPLTPEEAQTTRRPDFG